MRRSQAETGLKLFLALADGKEPDRSGRYVGKPRFQGSQRRMHPRRFFLGAVRAVLAGDKAVTSSAGDSTPSSAASNSTAEAAGNTSQSEPRACDNRRLM